VEVRQLGLATAAAESGSEIGGAPHEARSASPGKSASPRHMKGKKMGIEISQQPSVVDKVSSDMDELGGLIVPTVSAMDRYFASDSVALRPDVSSKRDAHGCPQMHASRNAAQGEETPTPTPTPLGSGSVRLRRPRPCIMQAALLAPSRTAGGHHHRLGFACLYYHN